MFKRISKEAQHITSHAIQWRDASLEALQTSDVQLALGAERTSRLTSLIEGVGVIALGARKNTVKSTSDVYIFPMPSRVPYGTAFTFNGVNFINGVRQRSPACAVVHDKSVIMIPLEDTFGVEERAGILTHEATHIDQSRRHKRYVDWSKPCTSAEKVLDESEAYEVQLRLLDVSCGGALADIADNSTVDCNEAADGYVMMTNGDRIASYRALSNTTQSVVSVAAAGRQFGYELDVPFSPPQPMIDLYARIGVISVKQ